MEEYEDFIREIDEELTWALPKYKTGWEHVVFDLADDDVTE